MTSVRFFLNYPVYCEHRVILPGARRSKVPSEAVLTESSYTVLWTLLYRLSYGLHSFLRRRRPRRTFLATNIPSSLELVDQTSNCCSGWGFYTVTSTVLEPQRRAVHWVSNLRRLFIVLWSTGFHLLPSFHHHPTQHNNITTVTLTVSLTSTSYNTIQILFLHVMWSAQGVRDSKIDHT